MFPNLSDFFVQDRGDFHLGINRQIQIMWHPSWVNWTLPDTRCSTVVPAGDRSPGLGIGVPFFSDQLCSHQLCSHIFLIHLIVSNSLLCYFLISSLNFQNRWSTISRCHTNKGQSLVLLFLGTIQSSFSPPLFCDEKVDPKLNVIKMYFLISLFSQP